MSKRLKVMVIVAICFLLILAFNSIRRNSSNIDLNKLRVKLLSAVRAGDNPDYLVFALSMQNLSDRSVYLENLNDNCALFIEGKEYRPRLVGNRPKIRLGEPETILQLEFKIGPKNPSNSILRIDGKCLGANDSSLEVLVDESTNLQRDAVIRTKRQ